MTSRVKDIIEIYDKGNIAGVTAYLFQPGMIIDPNTWAGKIKNLLNQKLYITAAIEIETIKYKFIKNINEDEDGENAGE